MKFVALSGLIAVTIATSAAGQTRSVRDTATAYGARLNAKEEPTRINSNRINSRVDSRLNNRLGLRIERYQIGSTNNPTSAFRAGQDDKSRVAPPTIAPKPATPEEE